MTTTRRAQRDRAQNALRMRAMRRTWAEVADACGYRSRQAAQIAVKRLLDSYAPDPDGERIVSAEGLGLLEGVLWKHFARADAQGDADSLLKLSKEIRSLSAEGSRLRGLYRPAQTEVAVTVAQSPREAIEEARQRTLESIIDVEVVNQ